MAYMDLFDKKAQRLTEKVVRYYDGRSKEDLQAFLSVYRKNALKKGMVPRTRNIFKPIIDKSGMLFNKAPQLDVYVNDAVDEGASATLQTVMESARWLEFFSNLDPMVRALKTTYVMPQVDPVTRRWVFIELNQANSAVKKNIFGDIELMLYVSDVRGEYTIYTVWTALEYFELEVDQHGNEKEVPGTREPNPYGMVPCVAFHDTNVPRSGSWNSIPEDLLEINDIYNLHITDSEFSSMWVKQPTLFTNAQIQSTPGTTGFELQHVFGEALPRYVPTSEPGFIGGPGTVVGLETAGEGVYLDYKGPNPPLGTLDDMVKKWVIDFAWDWSVAISIEGNGNAAESGFKLVVKELPNIELRKKRVKMFEAGFNRLYDVIQRMAATVGIALPEDGELWVDFGAMELPIDEKSSEEVWSRRINEKRATRVDYFMEVKGMTQAEAEAKVAEIDAIGVVEPLRPAPSSVVATTVTI